MLVKKIKYEDFNGDQREENFEFHLSEAEVVEMNLRYTGGLEKYVDSLNYSLDGNKVMDLMKDVIERSIGRKTPDGRFEKTVEVKNNFLYSEAYNVLFMELCTNADAATKFMNGIMPAKIKAQKMIDAKSQGQGGNYNPPVKS